MIETFNTLFSGAYHRLIAAILLIVSFFTVAKPDQVTLRVVSAEAEAITVEFTNETGRTVSPEQRFLLEIKTDNGWEPVPFQEGYAWNDIARTCLPRETGTVTVNALRCFGKPLEAGDYRFTMYYLCSGIAHSASVDFGI